jgi:hypothetical protein
LKLDRNKYLESRSLHPVSLLYALIAVNVILGVVVWLFPAEGISFGESGRLKFVSLNELKIEKLNTESEVNIDSVLQGVSPMGEPVAKLQDTSSEVAVQEVKATTDAKHDVPTHRSLQLPPNNPNALKTLIYALQTESKNKVVRILHYGDSQLEGDRISDYLRSKMQEVYGGEGPGILLPNEPAATSRMAALVSQSKTTKKMAFYAKDGVEKEGIYGLGGAVFKMNGTSSSFVNWAKDTNSGGQKAVFSGEKQSPNYIQIKNGYMGHSRARKFSKITLMYAATDVFQVKLTSDHYVNDYFLKPESKFNTHQWTLDTRKELRLDFVNGKFPWVYGVALDGSRGVAVDNFAMRGSSAVGFDKIDPTVYSKAMKAMNVRAVILQYGINVVPNVRSDYSYYRDILIKQLNSIKAANPGVTIIVIGPSDMSQNKNGSMVSYSNIPLIRNAMKEAAFATGSCFWDLYEAMGGKNSMSAWVNKGLAQKDYTHFSYKGAKYVGEMLFDAIIEKTED